MGDDNKLVVWNSFWPKNLPGIGEAAQADVWVVGVTMKGSQDTPMEDLCCLFIPDWSKLTSGDRVSVVITDLVWDGNTGLGRLTPGEQRVRLVGLVPPSVAGVLTVTFLDAVFLDFSSLVDLSLDSASLALCHQPLQVSHLRNLVELCAGGGFSSIGFTQVGYVHRCAVELQPKLADLHRRLHPGVPVLTADITDDRTAALIHAECPEPSVLMSGIACQPYSRAGKQGGGSDSRAATLPATVRLTNLLQSPVLIMECVVPARNNDFVVAHLQALEHQLGYHVMESCMKLEEVWSAHRYRWWVVATHRRLGRILIPSFPKGSMLVVRDLMPYTKRWSEDDESQLTLTTQEIERFQLGGEPLRKYVVQADQKLPTALHSWGGQTQGCACECRPQGFADFTLQSKGLFAQLLQIPGLGNQIKYRHMHAIEVAIHNGVPPLMNWSPDARLNLCAVGQLASPFHATWLASAVAAHMQMLFAQDTAIDPVQSLCNLKHLVMQQCKEIFPAIPRSIGQAASSSMPTERAEGCHLEVSDHAGATWTLAHHPTSTVQQLLEAECDLLHLPLFDVQVCNLDNQELPATDLLKDHHVVLLKRPGFPAPVVHQADPEVPFAPEDLLPCPIVTDVMEHAAGGPVIATQVDSDADMMGFDSTHDSIATTSHALPVHVDHQADDSVRPLLQLSPASLLEMVAPLVNDVDLCGTLRAVGISWQCRANLLERQEHVWADDEMLWQMQATVLHARKFAVILDPLLATTWLSSGSVDLIDAWVRSLDRPSDRIVSAVLLRGHWTPVMWILRSDCMEVHMYDHDDVDLNELNPLHGLLCRTFAFPSFTVSSQRRQFGINMCGPAAIAFLISKLNDSAMPSNEAELQDFGSQLREQFRVSNSSAQVVCRPWCWGAGVEELPTLLATLLQFHGVPSSVSKQRAKLVLQSLGRDAVKQAIEGVSPWKSLKHLANQHKPVIQLVLPDELALVIKDRKTKQPQVKEAKQQKARQVPARPVDLDPSRLQLEPDTFCTAPDAMLSQLHVSHVGPLSSGVALVTHAEALPFLQANKVLTNKGLALLIVNGPSELHTELQWSSIRFAAKCSVNQQPVLLHGFLVQLGNQMVIPYHKQACVSVPDVPVTCARITIFKDQWPQDWEVFSAHPVKEALQHILPLQTCRSEGCTCEKWHRDSMDQAQDVVLDVFKRQFFTDGGKPVRAHQASHFCVQLRYLKQQEAAVLRCSGTAGLYIEPRLPDSSMPSDEFQVVWMPQVTFSEAQHSMQCEPLSIGLARTGKRYGLRVPAKHFQTVFAKLKPDSQFLAPGERLHWHCGPWPFGSDRKMLAKVFSGMQWQARPLQPAKTVDGGIMWLVQSTAEPPQAVWNMQHGPVVVSRCESMSAPMLQSTQVIGPQTTVELCSNATEVDPWLTKDPWQGALRSVPVHSAPNVTTQIQEMEERIEKSLLARLPCEKMETDEDDSRVQQLELQIQQLATRQQSLEGIVHEHHNQHTAQVQTLQTQMMSQLEVQRSQMKGLFDDQMSRLEAILAKKGRHEWEPGSRRLKPAPAVSQPRPPQRVFAKFWVMMLMFFGLCCRIGEADKPGPTQPDQASWTLGICNPSGLLGKSTLLSDVNTDIIAVSETHLTNVSSRILLNSLRTRSAYKYVVTGSPMHPRTTASAAGQYAGVACVSRQPPRALCSAWPEHMYETGRVQIAGSLIGNQWITGAVVYGYPQSKIHPQAAEKTAGLLAHVFDHMVSQVQGPRYMTGDWNFTPEQLAISQQLRDAGWEEVQTLEYMRSGQPIRSTCKRKTQKDHLWLSPELIAAYQGLTFQDDMFPDHAVLRATFAAKQSSFVRYLWPLPQPVPWQTVPDLAHPVDFMQGDPTTLYASVWEQREMLAAQALDHVWQPQMRGRGQRTETTKRVGWPVPLKQGRSNDPQPQFFGYDVQHARWMRQLRRLHNYANWANSHWQTAGVTQWTHGLLLWRSILDAPGFCGSFTAWWKGRSSVGLSDPGFVPVSPPDPGTASQLCECFDAEVRSFERRLSQAKKSNRTQAHARNRNLIFQDTRRPAPEPVSSLLVHSKSEVVEVDQDDAAVIIEPPCQFDDSKPLLVGEVPVTVIHATDTKVYLESVDAAVPGMQVSQAQPLGALDEVFEAFHAQWKKRWCKHDQIPHSHWQQVIDFARATMPQWNLPALDVTPTLLQAEIAFKKPTAATGMDGVSRRDLQAAGPNLLQSLSQVCTRAQHDGAWPAQVITGKVGSLAKVPCPQGTGDYRPITVFSLLYRCFSSLQARHMLTLADEWCHEDIHGNRKQHQTAHLWRALVDQIQCAYDQGQCLSGLTADIEKAFNCLPRYPVLAMALHVGTPFGLLRAWSGALAGMVRRFRVRDSFSQGFMTSTGLAEGCALSCYGMLLLDDAMHRYVHAQCPSIRVLSFVDNWDFLTWDPHAAVKQLDVLMEFASLVDLTVDKGKAFAWSTSPGVRTALRAAGIPVRHFAKDLGSHVAFSRQGTNKLLLLGWTLLTSFGLSWRVAGRATWPSCVRCVVLPGLVVCLALPVRP